MPQGNNFTLTSNTAELSRTFAEYLKYNLRDIPEILQKKSRSLSISLFYATPKATKEEIAAKVQSLGWQVKRKYTGKREKGETAAAALQRMQQSIIKARFAHAGFMASGWLPAVWKFGGSVSAKTPQKVSNPNQRGYATIHISDTECYVEIVNSTPGIATLESNRPFVKKALDFEVDDMLKYIRDHQRKNANVFNVSGKV